MRYTASNYPQSVVISTWQHDSFGLADEEKKVKLFDLVFNVFKFHFIFQDLTDFLLLGIQLPAFSVNCALTCRSPSESDLLK